ncbi:iron transporter [Desulfoluna sp.]|uniref:iron transporter n=1 Tax=Desulfoluna sp. TaxID=2045199 RepID=UPI0026154D87|nr:iron transporter [Desulfoluna sp.]
MMSRDIFTQAAREGLSKGLAGFLWMMKILVPISFFTLVLDYTGIITKLDFILSPVMGILSLPPVAALPLIIGVLTGIYGAVAAMLVLPMAPEHMTLVAIFLLVSHNLIQESAIQGQSGIHPIKATLFRLTTSIITVLICAAFLNPPDTVPAGAGLATASDPAFLPLLEAWALATAALAAKIFLIIMTIMTTLQVMKAFNVIPVILKPLAPFMTLMGVDKKMGMLWLTATLFGLSYGSAVIVEETRENDFSDEELTRLHLSIGINHAMIEDPALFLPLGIAAFWLWIPRLIAAIVAVQVLNLWSRIRRPAKTDEAEAV